MVKKILIVSSNYTGHGHKSITEALGEQFARIPGVSIHVIDGFSLGGHFLMRVGKMYGSVTRNAKELWKLAWDMSFKKPSLVCEMFEPVIKDNFLRLLKGIKPDLILSVHPNFNGPIISILEDCNIKIPFVTLIADLVSISPLWADPRTDYIICPTQESKYKCMEFGVSESRLKVIGFPIRERFYKQTSSSAGDYKGDRPLECLIMSGGEGVGNMSRIAKILLRNFNCNVKILAGRNRVLRRRLELTLSERYGNRVQIHGFTENVQDLMLSSDIAFTRGSPNTMLEAVACNTPLVITGALPGQEEGNPGYAIKYNLGVVCRDLTKLKYIVADLLANNARKLNGIRESQRRFRNPNIVNEIVDFVLSVEHKVDHINIEEVIENYEKNNKNFFQRVRL